MLQTTGVRRQSVGKQLAQGGCAISQLCTGASRMASGRVSATVVRKDVFWESYDGGLMGFMAPSSILIRTQSYLCIILGLVQYLQ